MRCHPGICFCLFLSLLCGRTATVSGEDFSLGPAADAFVSSTYPSNNYGGAGAVAISAVGLPQGGFQAVFGFDLAGARLSFDTTFGAGNWLLDSASLQLTAAFPNNNLFNSSEAGEIALTWLQNDSWSEGSGRPNAPGASGVTWNTLPTFLSPDDESLGVIDFNGAASGTEVYQMIVSPGLAADALSGSMASILLSPAVDATAVSALFNSRSFNNEPSRPVLTLSAVAVPEPTSFAIAALSIASFASFGRMRRVY